MTAKKPSQTVSENNQASLSPEQIKQGFAMALHGIGYGAGKYLNCPEIAFNNEEIQALTESSYEVAKLYDVKVSPLYVAWAGLIFTLGTVGFSKYQIIKAHEAKLKAEREKQNDSQTEFSNI